MIHRLARLPLAVLLTVAALGCTPPADDQARTFTILQVNDLYRIEGLEAGTVGGMARLRSLRRQLEAENPVLMLHAGDALFPSVMSKYFSGEPMVDILNRLDGSAQGFDPNLLLTFGNHEFDGDLDVLEARLRQSEFRWVTSNIYFKPPPDGQPMAFNSLFPNVHHTVVLNLGGLRVGVFGLTVNSAEREYLHYDYASGPGDRSVRNATVRSALAALRDRSPDVVIALTHQGLTEDIQLAQDFPEIDLIVGGHDHVAQREEVDGTLITKADADARTAWVIEVTADESGTIRTDAELRVVDDSIAPDADVQQAVEGWMAELERQVPGFRDVVGETEHLLGGEEHLIRTRETAMGNWLADIVRQDLETDIALIHGGAVRINENIPAGSDLRVEHLEGIFYYDDQVVAFERSGQQLLDMLNNSVSRVDAGDGRFLQVSGLEFAYRPQPAEGERQVETDWVRVRRKGSEAFAPLDLEATYTVATLRHLWANGARYGYEGLAADVVVDGSPGTSPTLLPTPRPAPRQWRALTEAWLRRNERVTTGLEGRIVRLDPGTAP